MHTTFWWGNPKESDNLEDYIILKLILNHMMGRRGSDSTGSGWGQAAGFY